MLTGAAASRCEAGGIFPRRHAAALLHLSPSRKEAQPLLLVAFLDVAARKSKCSCLKSRNSFHHLSCSLSLSLSLHFTRRSHECRQRDRKFKLHLLEYMKFLLRKRSLTTTEKRAGVSLPFRAKCDLVPRLQSTASPEASSLRLLWCGH